MSVVLTTDIFGETDWTDRAKLAFGNKQNVIIISPYANKCAFENETKAYQAFTKLGGVEAYAKKITNHLSTLDAQDALLCIGFSAGASALWLSTSQIKLHENSHLIGFYPGQIRHYLDIRPSIDTSIIFPVQESHFDLTNVIQHLVTNQPVKVIQNQLMHGYANPLSSNFNRAESEQVLHMFKHSNMLRDQQAFLDHIIDRQGHDQILL